MNAIIRISSVEFTEAFFLKQKELLEGRHVQITIALNDEEGPSFMLNEPEPEGQYWNMPDRSIADIEAGKGTVYTMEELEALLHAKKK